MEDIRKTTKLQREINGKTYDVEVEVIRRKHLTGGIEFKINVTIELAAVRAGDTNFPGIGWPGKDGRVK